MTINPEARGRRSIRLRDYDYTLAGAYFVTIVTRDRKCLFGDVVDGEIRLNHWGRTVQDEWKKSAQIRKEIDWRPSL
jgi:REP-associated tyrosine transposase